MQTGFVIIIVLVALVVLVPMMFMVAALFRNVMATFRTPHRSAHSGDDEIKGWGER